MRRSIISSRLAFAAALILLLPPPTRSQPPSPQSELQLTAVEEKDAYEIYSILLKTEMPPQWKITAWAIAEETQSFLGSGARRDYSIESCLQPSHDQELTYHPLIEDYRAKNANKIILKRKFDLPQYALVGPKDVDAIQRRQRAPRLPLTTDEEDHPVFPFPNRPPDSWLERRRKRH